MKKKIIPLRKHIKSAALTDPEWKVAINKVPATLLASNSKLRKNGIYQWSIPAFMASITDKKGNLKEFKTCPNAGSCAAGCYAQIGTFTFKGVMIAHNKNLQFYLNDSNAWKQKMIEECKNKKIIRVHDSGDFFSLKYINDWFDIMHECPDVQFYTYSKLVSVFESIKSDIPSNFTIVYSFGGIHDHMIDVNTHRHSKVFSTHEAMIKAGYSDTTKNDINASNPSVMKIGLVYHNIKSIENVDQEFIHEK